VQEWLIWPVSKTERVVRLTQVQILSPPQVFTKASETQFQFLNLEFVWKIHEA
jgi:hypothetical protein